MQRMMQLFHSQSQISRHDKALTSESMHEILWCDHSYETCSAVLSHGAIQYSTLESVHEIPWHNDSNVNSSAVHVLSHFIIYYFSMYF